MVQSLSIQIIVERADETTWRPPQIADTPPQTKNEMSVAAIEADLGRQLLKPGMDEAIDLVRSARTGTWRSYFAEFGSGAALTYRKRSDNDEFWVTQSAVLSVQEPSRYIFNDSVEVEQFSLHGAPAVLWIPKFGTQYVSYIDWYPAGQFVSLNFAPGTSREFMLEAAQSMA